MRELGSALGLGPGRHAKMASRVASFNVIQAVAATRRRSSAARRTWRVGAHDDHGRRRLHAQKAGRNINWGVREHGWAPRSTAWRCTAGIVRPFGASFLHLHRLHAQPDPALGAHAIALDLGLLPRLGGPGRGRPDPPADRDARRAARRPRPRRSSGRPTPTRPRRPGASSWRTSTVPRCSRSRARTCRPARPGFDEEPRPRRLRPAQDGDEPDVVIIGTGSELSVAIGAAELLVRRRDPRARRLVAALGALRRAGRRLPRLGAAARAAAVAVEAGVPVGWDR